ncbi:MAG: trigger factor [Anaerolineae bacterium]|nr:trigger factor [Anaerolineae bacterium]
MKLQTEHLEQRRARLIVEVDPNDLQKAMQDAARRLSRRVRIPGFRQGKAPYHILSSYFGEEAILEEAVDKLGPDVYRDALDESGLEPYGPGGLVDVQVEDGLQLTFVLPLTPTVDLGDYRAVRKDFEAPEVTDEMVTEMLQNMQDSKAVLEPKDGPAEDGDQIEVDLYGELTDDDAAEGDAEESGEDDDKALFDETNRPVVLGDERYEMIPGFLAALAGISAEETRAFDLVFPDDEKYVDEVRGKTAHFDVTCHTVQARFVPALNDEFAQQYTDGELETLLELRMRVRETAAQRLEEEAKNAYVESVLHDLTEQATIEYPEEMIEQYIDDMVESFTNNLKRQGMSLQDYLALNQLTDKALRDDFRETAIDRLKTSLVLGEIVHVEQLDVDDVAIDAEVRARSRAFSDNEQLQEQIMQFLSSNAESRRDIALNLMTQRAYDRIAAIAKGEEPPVGPPPAAAEEEDAAAEGEDAPDIAEAEPKAVDEVTANSAEGDASAD